MGTKQSVLQFSAYATILNKPTDWRGVTFPRVIEMDKTGWAQRNEQTNMLTTA